MEENRMVSLDLQLHQGIPGVVTDNYVTAQAASDLTGYNIQYIRHSSLKELNLKLLSLLHGYPHPDREAWDKTYR
jgi:hypothetical protein